MVVRLIRKSKLKDNSEPDALVELPRPTSPIANNVDAQPVSLAMVIERLHADAKGSSRLQTDQASACRMTAKLAGRNPKDILATAAELRRIFRECKPRAHRMSAKRVANIKSGVAQACQAVGAFPSMSPDQPLTTEWKAFIQRANKKFHGHSVVRLGRYCSEMGLNPTDVTDVVMMSFEAYLSARIVTAEPSKIRRSTSIAFNRICKDNNFFNCAKLGPRSSTHYASPPLEVYPPSIQADIASFLDRRATTDRFGDFDSGAFYRETTVRNIKAQLRQLLDAAVIAGISRGSLVSLAVLVQKPVWSKAFETIRTRIGKKYPTTLTNLSRMLLVIARHHVKAPEEQIRSLMAASKAISQGNGLATRQMGERSRAVMRQFEHPENIAAVVQLPAMLMRGADRQRRTCDGALDAMIAAAVTIILNVPLRMQNVADLTFGSTFIQSVLKGGKPKYEIDVPAHDTKNLVHMEGEIEQDDAKVISVYIQKFRPLIYSGASDALFPRPGGSPRPPDKLSQMISDRIAKHTGLKMNSHCFRHLAAKIYLDAHPGHYEDVRRILGHKTVKTTIDFYSPRETKSSQRRYHSSLALYKGKDN